MIPTRVLMTSVPRILAEIVQDAAADSPEVEMIQLMGPEVETGRVAREVARIGPDVVLVGLRGQETVQDYAELLEVRPEVRVVAVAPDGGSVDLYELSPRVTHIGNVPPGELLSVIRGSTAAAAPGRPGE